MTSNKQTNRPGVVQDSAWPTNRRTQGCQASAENQPKICDMGYQPCCVGSADRTPVLNCCNSLPALKEAAGKKTLDCPSLPGMIYKFIFLEGLNELTKQVLLYTSAVYSGCKFAREIKTSVGALQNRCCKNSYDSALLVKESDTFRYSNDYNDVWGITTKVRTWEDLNLKQMFRSQWLSAGDGHHFGNHGTVVCVSLSGTDYFLHWWLVIISTVIEHQHPIS